MTPRYAFSAWFANGAGYARRHHGSSTMLIDWNGKGDGAVTLRDAYVASRDRKTGGLKSRKVTHYYRNSRLYTTRAALFRGIEEEHTKKPPT